MRLHKYLLVILIIFLIITGTIWAQETILYSVRSGDSLSEIAKQFNVTLKQLVSLNQIENPDLIRIGQKLKIPAQKIVYEVQKGDSITKIASKYSIEPKKIIVLNNIEDPDQIFIGQKLNIPVSNEEKTKTVISRYQQLNFIWPAQGKISSPYGWRDDPITSKREYHAGIDIALPIGCPIYASETGVVTFSGWSGGYGKLIIIQHRDDKKTYYGHNVELLVKEGDIVNKGKIIALSGNSGRSTGPHLHFEIRDHGRIQDPLNFLNKIYMQKGFRV